MLFLRRAVFGVSQKREPSISLVSDLLPLITQLGGTRRKASAVHVSLSSYSIVKEQIKRKTLYRPIA